MTVIPGLALDGALEAMGGCRECRSVGRDCCTGQAGPNQHRPGHVPGGGTV